MSNSTNFVDRQTVIQPGWANDVDAVVFQALGDGSNNPPTTPTQVRANLSIKDDAETAATTAIYSVRDEPFGATGDGVADDTAEVLAAAAAVQSAGGGTLRFPAGTYSVAPTKGLLADYPNETAWITFTGLTGVTIDASEAIIADANTYLTTQCAILFKFVDCTNITVNIAKVTSAYGVNSGTTWADEEGLHLLRFSGGCSNIDINVTQDGGSDCVRFASTGAAAESAKSKFIRARIKTYKVRKPYSCAFAGNDADVHIDAEWCGRNFMVYGVKNQKIIVRSKNQRISSRIDAYDGVGCTNVYAEIYDKGSTDCQSAAPNLEIAYGDSTPAEMNNIHVHVDVDNDIANPFGHTVAFKKYLNSSGSTPDTTGRGHVLDGFKLTGKSYQVSPSQHLTEYGGGEFASPDVIRNFSIENFTGLNSGDIRLDTWMTCLGGPAVLTNVYCNENIRITGNATDQIVMIGCEAGELCDATNDTSLISYIGCNIRDGTIQGFSGKSFYNTRLAGVLLSDGQNYNPINHLTATKLLTGDLTGTNNIFRYKDTTAGAYFRLKYYLVADRTDTNPATRDETFGIKSFCGSHNSSGVWATFQAPANEVTEKTLGTASALTVSLVNGDATNGGYIAVACTNYNGANARGMFVLEAVPAKFSAGEVAVLVAL